MLTSVLSTARRASWPARARQVPQRLIAEATDAVAIDPIVDGRSRHLISPRHEAGAFAAIEIEQSLRPPQHTDFPRVSCEASEILSFLIGQAKGHAGLALQQRQTPPIVGSPGMIGNWTEGHYQQVLLAPPQVTIPSNCRVMRRCFDRSNR